MARSSKDEPAVITSARNSHSDDLEMRQRRYAVTMAIRTACFVALIFTHGWLRWACVAGAALLPGIAVVLANARDNRTPPSELAHHDDEPSTLPQLSPGPVIPGEVEEHHTV